MHVKMLYTLQMSSKIIAAILFQTFIPWKEVNLSCVNQG